ncbi:hypothetical protein BOTBODRAFT_59467 [Botryobasidium botryosum FD-172 SS1]|uniref:Osmotin thaumatin-like protein n=1 Tax=Botryobasidium botryosum (strain FD-172 SS1) TaxID=930990 RepID=A0A067M9J5_BOTB1|nr:hypothetical protein BOTBODRAFT_59467 [Botryobasidium botryosum FD-172 SS1]
MFSLQKLAVSALLFVGSASAAHTFNLVNRCGSGVPLLVHNWGRTPYTGAQPGTVGAGQTRTLTMPDGWNGRICHNVGGCGNSCYGSCSMTEFNLDTGDFYTPQAYDISNIQGYTIAQSISVANDGGCQSVTCRAANCPCSQAYPIGDLSGCGNDSPVRACGAGAKAFTITCC